MNPWDLFIGMLGWLALIVAVTFVAAIVVITVTSLAAQVRVIWRKGGRR